MDFCVICNSCIVDKHHIKTRGSGGSNHENNLVNLCRKHHNEIHNYGMFKFTHLYPVFRYELIKRGWEYSEFRGKWVNDNDYITS